jgi:hypothetical protein
VPRRSTTSVSPLASNAGASSFSCLMPTRRIPALPARGSYRHGHCREAHAETQPGPDPARKAAVVEPPRGPGESPALAR